MSTERNAEKAALRARLAEIDAEEVQERESATSAPEEQAKSQSGHLAIWIAVVIAILALIATRANMNSPSNGNDAPSTASGQDVTSPPTGVAVQPEVDATPVWTSITLDDPMADRPSQLRCIRSENLIRLSWPYSSTHAELCIRASERHGRDAFVRLLGEGQILCRSYSGCTVRMRFDDGSVQSYSANEAVDHSSNIFFIENVSRFERAIGSAAVTRIEFEIYQDGVQSAEFHTSGYEPTQLAE